MPPNPLTSHPLSGKISFDCTRQVLLLNLCEDNLARQESDSLDGKLRGEVLTGVVPSHLCLNSHQSEQAKLFKV